MLTISEIENIKNEIVLIVADQVMKGEQSLSLNDNNMAACGQFILKHNMPQRGLHGTSAALRVLAAANSSDSRGYVPKMIMYLNQREEIEKDKLPQEEIEKESNNVIKISEILYSLRYVGVGQAQKEDLATKCYSLLSQNLQHNESWPYFINSHDKTPNLLPTIFAAQAIFANGYQNYRKVHNYILNNISKDAEKLDNPSTFAICVFGLYVLTFLYGSRTSDDEKKYKVVFKKLWNSKLNILDSDIEQNIEYWYNSSNSYVRIPWQLYLIPLASKYSDAAFADGNLQKRIISIKNQVENRNGFKYEYSGVNISTRTNAIVYEILTQLSTNLINRNFYILFSIINSVRIFFASNLFKVIIWFAVLIIFFYLSYKYYHSNLNKDKIIEELLPHIIYGAILGMLALGKKKK